MIKVNGIKINVEHFPDGTQRLMKIDNSLFLINPENTTPYFEIVWLYENDGEMFTLMCIVEHIRENCIYGNNSVFNLVLGYCPNGRMDRTYSNEEIFTLKYFAKFINSLNFNKVGILDPHSNVSLALINNVSEMNHIPFNINQSIISISYDYNEDIYPNIAIYFPDEGAYKRYKKYFTSGIKRYCVYGKKVRDWSTGQILGLEIYNEQDVKVTEKDIKDKIFLMIDDIVSYGGTMAYGADKLKELGAKEVYAYASHTENSILDKEKGTLLKRLENGTVKKLFTTNSLYSGTNKNIELVYEY